MADSNNNGGRVYIPSVLVSEDPAAADHSVLRWFALLIGAMLALAIFSGTARAEPSLGGSWSGGGWVNFTSGSRERARCRAHYTANSATSYNLSATCATPSGSVSQSATLRKAGAHSYVGSFYNSQYNVSGSIRVTLHGNSQSVTLSSQSGSASLSLSRG
jgi:hypothetical protein